MESSETVEPETKSEAVVPETSRAAYVQPPAQPQTELQFLIELLLNHKLNTVTKNALKERIGFVETSLRQAPGVPRGTISPIAAHHATIQQAPSTLAAMAKHTLPESAFTAPVSNNTFVPQGAMSIRRVVGGEVHTPGGARGPRKF